MNKILIIAEKPSLAKTIIKAVGGQGAFKDYYENNQYVITSQFRSPFRIEIYWRLSKRART